MLKEENFKQENFSCHQLWSEHKLCRWTFVKFVENKNVKWTFFEFQTITENSKTYKRFERKADEFCSWFWSRPKIIFCVFRCGKFSRWKMALIGLWCWVLAVSIQFNSRFGFSVSNFLERLRDLKESFFLISAEEIMRRIGIVYCFLFFTKTFPRKVWQIHHHLYFSCVATTIY